MVSTVSLGLLAGPIAMAGPATAMPNHSRKADCTVTALDPYASNHGREAMRGDPRNGNRKSVRVSFPFRIHCDKDAQVRYNQRMFQKHDRWDTEEIGNAWDTVWVSGHDRIVNVERVTADRGERSVTVYHTVRIRVQDDRGGHRNGSSDFDRSNTVTIWVSNNHR
ncbi:hypothetical protein B1A87_021035 [Arthrobacter sp. KBS0703]|uniref:hypothetical protein n=1 Tax=Bacteria TaxID=2 RepID=UPI00111795B5|nr:hypothetical protein [Arthrobacter sp. KBS0703]TSE14354.1 hypothetical protein B1A87_021035 [Arthrobacter sp. KBS0703]